MGSVEYVWLFAVGGIVRVSVVARASRLIGSCLLLNAPSFVPFPLGGSSAASWLYVIHIADMPVIEIGSNYAGLLRPLEHHLNLETHQYIYIYVVMIFPYVIIWARTFEIL